MVETFFNTGVQHLATSVPDLRNKMGAIHLGNMSNGVLVPLRTTLILAVIIICLFWSLLAFDVPRGSLEISKAGAQDVIIEAQNTADNVAAGSTTNGDTGVEVTIPSTSAQGSEVGDAIEPSPGNRPLILYVYADSKDGSARENLEFFIAHGLHAAADFVFIFNGETSANALVPKKDNIRLVQRPNECYDLGAYAEVLLKDDLYKKYKRFITLNASVRGPFIPYWSEGCWTDMFLNRVTDEVKLVGITANCWPSFHIQSMIWATDSIGISTLLFPPPKALSYLNDHPIKLPPISKNTTFVTTPTDSTSPTPKDPYQTFQAPGINGCFRNWDSAVAAEISSTSVILAAGYKVDAMMMAYHGNAQYEEARSCEENADLLWEGGYFGISVHPFETVFIKANRDLSPLVIKKYSDWIKGRRYSSYDYCKA